MSVKTCSLCKKAAYKAATTRRKPIFWICTDCQAKVEGAVVEATSSEGNSNHTGNLCDKCRKRSDSCRFSPAQRMNFTACSDWEGKNTERNRKRWAKYEN